MKKVIAMMALMVSAFSVRADCAVQSFAVSPCTSQVIMTSPNNVNASYVTTVSIGKDACNPCGPKIATISYAPVVTACAPKVVSYTAPCKVSCDPCQEKSPCEAWGVSSQA